MYYTEQLALFDIKTDATARLSTSTTFVDNMKLPIHRWFRYSAGFSAEWVKNVIKEHKKNDSMILDPFAGSGTTLIAANELDLPSVGYEKQYFIRRIAHNKLRYDVDFSYLKELCKGVVNVGPIRDFNFEGQTDLLKKCYDKETLKMLVSMKNNFMKIADNTLESEIIWLAITAILRSTSSVGTAQWQYILPKKNKKKVLSPQDAFFRKINEIMQDIRLFNAQKINSLGIVLDHDARECRLEYSNAFDILITSPPYPNNYDYADATRLEMIFWGDITSWGDLHSKVRYSLIRSCSQHSAAEKLKLDDVLSDSALDPIKDEVAEVCRKLEKVRLERGGKKTYHTMIAAYYRDLAHVFIALRPLMKENSTNCFVIGDSAPYGIYAPADEWLGKLALSAGFESWTFEKTRDRNIKWKNRKHDVPLKEGRLWIRG